MNSKLATTLPLAIAFAVTAAASQAQTYPQRPIRIISPNSAAGANDTIGRIVALKLGEVLDQQVVVDNRGGAGGIIGADIVAKRPRTAEQVPRALVRDATRERDAAPEFDSRSYARLCGRIPK